MSVPPAHTDPSLTLRMTSVGEIRERWRGKIDPRDLELLIADVSGHTRTWVLAHGEAPVDAAAVEALVERRLAGEPLQYIRGRCDFFGREYVVDDRVLIPRPETELLVETAIMRAPRGARVVDVGAGSGCVAISLERARTDLHVIAVDVSVAALAVATRNARAHRSRVRFAASNVLDALRGAFDIVVSNPPYIAGDDVAGLQVEVREHEPRVALTPGPRGTEVIERIFDSAGNALVLMEIGFGQADAVRAVAASRGFIVDEVRDDLAGIPRIVVASRHAG
jgi:release factor glutamine methyltransferase